MSFSVITLHSFTVHCFWRCCSGSYLSMCTASNRKLYMKFSCTYAQLNFYVKTYCCSVENWRRKIILIMRRKFYTLINVKQWIKIIFFELFAIIINDYFFQYWKTSSKFLWLKFDLLNSIVKSFLFYI